jgi:hypothetical protein
MARTLFQTMKARLSTANELKVYNPLKIRLGVAVRIDAIDLRDRYFNVVSMRDCDRAINGRSYRFADYDLLHGTERRRLRLFPPESVMLLSLYFECGHQEAQDGGLAQTLADATGEFEIDWNGKRTYFRIGDLKTPHLVNATLLEDLDANGIVEDDELRQQQFEYWDFHTELSDEAGQKYVEYLFVERNTEDGFFQIWRGSEVDPAAVTVL